MVALKGSDIDAFAARPDPKRPIALVFGPDAGLVRERVDAIIKAAVDDPADPFALARLEGDALADEPTRLVEEMRAAGLTITADARALLASLIGGDRRASRSEVRKLALYAHGKKAADVDDVLAVVADASALALDGVVDAAFAGRAPEVETKLAKVRAAGTYPGVIIGAAL